jgi:hypothetical protein
MVLIDHNTKGTKQGTIKYAPETRITCPCQGLESPKAKNHPPNRSLGFHPCYVWTETWAIFLILSVIYFMTIFKKIINLQSAVV